MCVCVREKKKKRKRRTPLTTRRYERNNERVVRLITQERKKRLGRPDNRQERDRLRGEIQKKKEREG